MRVDGKVVLIAGGSGALGGTVVPAFLAAGARAVFADTALFVSHVAARPKILAAADPNTPAPTLTFTDRMAIDLGGQHVELIYTGKNHSDNSLVVLLPQHKLPSPSISFPWRRSPTAQ